MEADGAGSTHEQQRARIWAQYWAGVLDMDAATLQLLRLDQAARRARAQVGAPVQSQGCARVRTARRGRL